MKYARLAHTKLKMSLNKWSSYFLKLGSIWYSKSDFSEILLLASNSAVGNWDIVYKTRKFHWEVPLRQKFVYFQLLFTLSLLPILHKIKISPFLSNALMQYIILPLVSKKQGILDVEWYHWYVQSKSRFLPHNAFV